MWRSLVLDAFPVQDALKSSSPGDDGVSSMSEVRLGSMNSSHTGDRHYANLMWNYDVHYNYVPIMYDSLFYKYMQ